MVRDGRDVVQSLERMPWWRWGPEAAARLWIESSDAAAQLAQAFPDRVLPIRHELVLTRPEQALAAAMHALGLAFRTRQIDETTSSAVVLDRSMAWKGLALEPIDPCRTQQLRASQPPLPAPIAAILEPGLARLGYLHPDAGQSDGLPSAAQRSNAAS
jgi:hypothetical protein